MNKYYVYILKCSDESLYTGYTVNLEKRLERHNLGLASKYTRTRRPVKMVYTYEAESKSDALKKEALIKRQVRATKIKLIKNEIDISTL